MLRAWRTFLLANGPFGSKLLWPVMYHWPPMYTETQSTASEDWKRFRPLASASLCSSRGRSAMWTSPESSNARRVASSRAIRNSSSSKSTLLPDQCLSLRLNTMLRPVCRPPYMKGPVPAGRLSRPSTPSLSHCALLVMRRSPERWTANIMDGGMIGFLKRNTTVYLSTGFTSSAVTHIARSVAVESLRISSEWACTTSADVISP